MEEIYLRFPAKMKYLSLATSLCREMCVRIHKQDLDKDFVGDVELSISEACTNAIKYGSRKKSEDKISVCFRIFDEKVVIRIGEKGKGFNIDEILAPDLRDLPEGGYGIYIIKAKMDEVRYIQEQKENYLEMVKYFRKSKR